MELDKAYEGREHSAVKHALLKGYLEKLLFIKGMKGTKEIVYVDCFAGPIKMKVRIFRRPLSPYPSVS
jgi:hypothetical protein